MASKVSPKAGGLVGWLDGLVTSLVETWLDGFLGWGEPPPQVETFLNGPLLVEVHSFGGSKLQFRLREEASFMELYHSTEARKRSSRYQVGTRMTC